MMFRFVNRLKKKHGAVLFVVIAVMALLIAMSSAAYYTARGSYNTVASNYNYSQLYLSAISSADMISAAIMNQPVPSAAGVKNNFTTIQGELRDNLNNVGDVVYLKTSNLSSLSIDATTSPGDVINALKNVPSAEPGVLDGLTVEIRVTYVGGFNVPLSGHDTSASTPTATVDHQTGTTPITYAVTTTAYYNDNTITVQDYIKTEKKGNRTVTTPKSTPGGGGGALPTDFNPNIATGQGQPGTSGSFEDAGRTVIVSVKELNGDMAFRNAKTMIGSPNFNNVDNKLNGGLVSEGSLYLVKGGGQVTGTNNNWYVGDDLVFADAQAKLDLGQNDLYVGGDFIYSANGGTIKARDIYIDGDLYVLNNMMINAENIHVNGNIYFATHDEDGKPRTNAFDNVPITETNGGDANARFKDGGANLYLHGHVITNGKTANGDTVTASTVNLGKYSNIANNTTHSEANGIGDFDHNAETKHQYTVLTAAENGESYDKVLTTGSTLDAIKSNTNRDKTDENQSSAVKSVYPNYTAGQDAYDNVATVDFGALDEVKNSSGQVTGYKGEFPIGSTGQYITVTIDSPDKWNTEDVKIDIPYVEDGFTLQYQTTIEESHWDPTIPNEWGGMGANVTTTSTESGLKSLSNQNILHYNIETDPSGSGKSMPIVLAANKDDGSFSWSGDSSVKGADVSVGGTGKVTFEMGNYNTETGKYEPFEVANADKYQIPTYVQGSTGQQFTVVGSSTQLEEIDPGSNFDGLTAANAANITQRSNVMLVTNKGTEAIRSDGKNGLFCGYIYAPNGTLRADNDTNGCVISVGSIVISSYEAQHADYHVSLPSPNDMSDFIAALDGDTGVDWGSINGGSSSPGSPGSPGGPPTSTPITYTSFENWSLVGSNYVGDPLIPTSGGSGDSSEGGSTAGDSAA